MEWDAMTTKVDLDLNFEDDSSALKSMKIIRSEYFKKGVKSLIYIGIVVLIYVLYFIFSFFPNLMYNQLPEVRVYVSTFTAGWALFSISVFLVFYLVKLFFQKFTPSLVQFIQKEFKYMGFKLQRSFNSGLLFLMLNSISIALLIYVDFGLIQFDNTFMGFFLQVLFITYLAMSLILPILWGIFNDKYMIKLKNNYYILFDSIYHIRKRKGHDPNLIGITLTSNRLSSRYDRCGKLVHTIISQRRWLSKKKKKIQLNPFLHFYEFSTPFNFQKQFLNITMALNEWERNYKGRIPCYNLPSQDMQPYDKYHAFSKFFNF